MTVKLIANSESFKGLAPCLYCPDGGAPELVRIDTHCNRGDSFTTPHIHLDLTYECGRCYRVFAVRLHSFPVEMYYGDIIVATDPGGTTGRYGEVHDDVSGGHDHDRMVPLRRPEYGPSSETTDDRNRNITLVERVVEVSGLHSTWFGEWTIRKGAGREGNPSPSPRLAAAQRRYEQAKAGTQILDSIGSPDDPEARARSEAR